jgi:ABC-type glycerol-3-phosphate transport system substrate-binding protein
MFRPGAVRPADRLFFILALAVLGISAAIRFWPRPEPEEVKAPEPPRLVIGLAEPGGFTARDLETLIRGADIDIGISSGEEQADILITGGQFLAAGIGAGRYLPLNQGRLPEASPLPLTRAEPSPPDLSPAAGRWALPLVSAVDILVYNISLLGEAGFDRPPRTWAEVLRYARGVKAYDQAISQAANQDSGQTAAGRYGLALGLSPQDRRGLNRDIYPWFRSAGLPLAQDGKVRLDLRRCEETLEFFSRLNQEGLLAPGSFTATGADRVEDFIRGTVAMLIVSSRDLQEIREKMGNAAVGVTLIPQAGDYTGKPVLGLSTWYAAIGADSPHPEEARALLRRLRDRSPLLAESLALVPGAGAYEPYIALDPLLDKVWGMYEAAELVPDYLDLDPPAGPPGAGNPETALRRELEYLLRRESPRSPAEAAQAILRSFEPWNRPEHL